MIEITRVVADEIKTLSQLGKETYVQAFQHTWIHKNLFEEYVEKTFSYDALLKQFKEEGVHFYFVKEGSDLLGYFKFRIEKNSMHLSKLYFLQSATGKKVGTYCMDFMSRICHELHLNTMELEVLISNEKAIHFYRKYGFVDVTTIENYADKTREPLLVMKRQL